MTVLNEKSFPDNLTFIHIGLRAYREQSPDQVCFVVVQLVIRRILEFLPYSPWLQNVLNIDSWSHCMKGGKEFRAVGIKERRERVADVTRIIT